jgi:hypothetical protein
MNIGSVKIHAVPDVRVRWNWVTTSVAKKTLTVRTRLENRSAQAVTVNVGGEVVLKEKSVFALPLRTVTLAAGQTREVTVTRRWDAPQLWSPWSPTLYGLKTEVKSGSKVLDATADRFGFREITIKGDQILLNGKIFHGLGHEEGSDHTSEIVPLLDFNAHVQHLKEVRERGYTYLRRSKLPRYIHNIHDELGLMISVFYGPWDNHSGQVGSDDETADIYAREAENNIPHFVNHPSILYYNHGNEVMGGGNTSNALALSLFKTVQRIKKLDPTRLILTQGSADLNGRNETMSSHYGDYKFWGIPLAQIPAEIRERSPLFSKMNWDRSKPMNVDEFSWLLPRGGYSWYGEAALKQTPFREEGYRPDRLHDIYPMIARREREFHSYRRSQTSAFAAFAPPFISSENIAPVLALFFQENTRFWAGQPIERVVDVLNDSGADGMVEVTLQTTVNGKTSTAWTQKIPVAQGQVRTVTAKIPAIAATKLTNVRAQLISRVNGVEQSRRVQHWEIFPKSWLGQLSSAKVGLFDPHNSTRGLWEFLGVKPVVISNISTLSQQEIDLLVVGENIESAMSALLLARLRRG